MQKDRKQIQILLYLVAPVVLLWLTFGASFSYELGKNGLHHINWGWIFQACLPVIIISVWMMFYAVRMIRAERVRKNKNYMDLEY
jgi:ABC-type dipeptide/oligopeptide/nickel transport system permease component